MDHHANGTFAPLLQVSKSTGRLTPSVPFDDFFGSLTSHGNPSGEGLLNPQQSLGNFSPMPPATMSVFLSSQQQNAPPPYGSQQMHDSQVGAGICLSLLFSLLQSAYTVDVIFIRWWFL